MCIRDRSKSVPLAFTGLAVAMGQRCGMLNIGAEGQLHAGAMAAVITALAFPSLPPFLLLTVSVGAGILAGMAVGSVPGIFRAKYKTNEVIVAIMLNYICTLFTSWLVNGPYKVEGSTAQTELIPEADVYKRQGQRVHHEDRRLHQGDHGQLRRGVRRRAEGG